MNQIAQIRPANDDGICANILEQIKRVTAAQAVVDGIDWADLSEPGNPLEDSYFAAKDEVLVLRSMLENVGIDPDVFGGAFR